MACPHYSEGCRTAREQIEARGRGEFSRLEKVLRTDGGQPLAHGVLHRLLSGERPCSLPMALQMETELGVDPALWTKKAT